ncbi:hypothetical protein EBU95_07795 [bacterium]|nr:hypothetical protein [bacterium]
MTSNIKLSKIIFENLPSQDILKVFAGFVENLLKGELRQFQNYGKKLTGNQLLELVKTGKIAKFESGKSEITTSSELENFRKMLLNAKFDFGYLNEFNEKIEKIIDLIDKIKPILEGDNLQAKQYAYQLVFKVYKYLEGLKSIYADASVEFGKKLPQGFNPDAKDELVGSQQIQITQIMSKPGLVRSILKKLVDEGFYASTEAGPAISHLDKMVKELSVKE